MGIKVISSNANTITHIGYCHEISLVISANGAVAPSTINLGNRGDQSIAELVFDLRNLISSNTISSDLSKYYGRIVIFDTTRERDRSSSVMPNPMTYELDSAVLKEGRWSLPDYWTTYARTYCFIFALVEKSSGGSVSAEKEIFVSKEFTGTVTDTSWSTSIQTAINNAITVSDDENAWSKPALKITPSTDHYTINAANSDIGVKLDRYVKRIVLDNSLSSVYDEGLNMKYAIFWKGTEYYATKFNSIAKKYNIDTCWVPKQVNRVSGSWNFMIVEQTDSSATTFKRWVSNTLALEITDNFLEQGDLNIGIEPSSYYMVTTSATAPTSGATAVDTTTIFGDNAAGQEVTIEDENKYIWVLNPTQGNTLQAYNQVFGWADLDDVVVTTVQYTPTGSSTAVTLYAYRSTLFTPDSYKIRLTETAE